MAETNVTIPADFLSSFLSEPNGFAKLLETVLNQILNAQAEDQIGAAPYERTEGRVAYRNGYRTRQLYTRVGQLTLRVPQFRDGQFSTEIFARYQRSEQALVLSMMEMVLNGVSTRKVTKITEELCGTSFSKSTVSQLCLALDAKVEAFNERELGCFPFVIVDAMVVKVRENGKVVSKSALIMSGVNVDGYREILGLRIGDSESEISWLDAFRWLKQRGLHGVDYIISDSHSGLVKSAMRCFQGASWQRCQVHLRQNVLTSTRPSYRRTVNEAIKEVFDAPDATEARRRFNLMAERLENHVPKAIECLEAGLEDALAIMTLPKKYRKRLRSTNMQERLNEEVRRRERVIRIFPNQQSAHRMIGAILAEHHEGWMGRRYLDMTEYREWIQAGTKEQELIV
ncbi:MAG: IS256 family transposase [Desulfovibrionales bacterium]|nr:IS256 family transposase [Desulfovibrionales bacterium]